MDLAEFELFSEALVNSSCTYEFKAFSKSFHATHIDRTLLNYAAIIPISDAQTQAFA